MDEQEREAALYGLREHGARLLTWSTYPDDDEDGKPEIAGLTLYDAFGHQLGWPAVDAEDACYALADEYSDVHTGTYKTGHYLLNLESVAWGESYEDCCSHRDLLAGEGAINSVADLAPYVSAYENDIEAISHRVYKATSCGAWCALTPGGVKVGSIVEGCDEGTDIHELLYPFTIDDFWAALDAVEKEAKDIWDDTHGCRWCFTGATEEEIAQAQEDDPDGEYDLDFEDYGARPVDPSCLACDGHGLCL